MADDLGTDQVDAATAEPAVTMRRFELYRPDDAGRPVLVAEGCQWSDGSVGLRRIDADCLWSSHITLERALEVTGVKEPVWIDEAPAVTG